MNIFSKLGWFFKQEKKRYIIGISFLALTSIANLVPPRILGLMADQLDKGSISWGEYGALILAVIAAAIVLYLLRYFWRKQIWHILHKGEKNLLLEATEEKGWRE